MGKTRAYKGQPEFQEPWQCIGRLACEDNLEWLVCSKKANNPSWSTLKIACNGQAPKKANYWTGWDGERIANSRDIQMMRAHRPSLASELEAFLNDD